MDANTPTLLWRVGPLMPHGVRRFRHRNVRRTALLSVCLSFRGALENQLNVNTRDMIFYIMVGAFALFLLYYLIGYATEP